MVPTLFALPELPTVTPPETVNFGLPEEANVSVAVPEPDGVKPRLAHAAVALLTVTTCVPKIVTVSRQPVHHGGIMAMTPPILLPYAPRTGYVTWGKL